MQPGTFLKATLFSATFPTGSYEMRIDGYNAAGDFLRGETHTLFIDNEVPTVVISNIDLAGVPVDISGVGCTLQTLTPAELSAALAVTYKVDHTQGAILDYALRISRCNEGADVPDALCERWSAVVHLGARQCGGLRDGAKLPPRDDRGSRP